MASCRLSTLSVVLVVASALQSPVCSLACSTTVSYGGAQLFYARCQDLPSQGAALAYTYFPATRRLRVAFSGIAPSATGWVGWGINPLSWGMLGSSVLVAFQASNGSNVLPFKLTANIVAGDRLLCSPVDFSLVSRAVDISGVRMTIFATFQLSPGQTVLNMIWNRGAYVSGFSPLPHSLSPADLLGYTTVDVAL